MQGGNAVQEALMQALRIAHEVLGPDASETAVLTVFNHLN